MDYHRGALVEAEAAFSRIEGFIERAGKRLEGSGVSDGVPGQIPDAFANAMDDDLGVPQALGVLHDTVRAGNAALDADDLATVARLRAEVEAMTGLLGVNPLDPMWAGIGGGAAEAALGSLVQRLIDDRERARGAKDFAAADRIRDELTSAGIAIDDTAAGTQWSLDG
jgi:cysteinyl-tRNA synthetase